MNDMSLACKEAQGRNPVREDRESPAFMPGRMSNFILSWKQT